MAIVNSHVYNTVLDIIRADKRGLALSIEEYNRISRLINEEIYAKYYSDFERDISNIDVLGGFKVLDTTVTLVADGTSRLAWAGSLPTDYYEVIGKPRYVNAAGVIVNVDLVSSLELAERMEDYLTQPTAVHPVYIMGEVDGSDNTKINVYPSTITFSGGNRVFIDYLRVAATPYLDYYVNDVTLVPTYLVDGATAVSIPVNYTYSTGQAGAFVLANSLTQDWEWGDAEFPLIISKFCQYLGIALPDQLLIETGVVNESKN
jgi:hypothetical protein